MYMWLHVAVCMLLWRMYLVYVITYVCDVYVAMSSSHPGLPYGFGTLWCMHVTYVCCRMYVAYVCCPVSKDICL